MSHLLRGHAPITAARWSEIDEEARTRLSPHLGARQIVDFRGPHGWQASATSLGRIAALGEREWAGTLTAAARRVLPMIELRAPFELSRAELADGDRGAEDVDFAPLDAGARAIATAENAAILNGWPDASVAGVRPSSPHEVCRAAGVEGLADAVAQAIQTLFDAGVGGPFALALGSEVWASVQGFTDGGGWPLINHLREILTGPVIYAPGADHGVVLSLRGGDFLLDIGEDLSVGYGAHDRDGVELYLEESFTFHVATPEAAVALEFGGAA